MEKLTTLFYLLIRDSMPAGELIKFVIMTQESGEGVTYTNPHILALAKDLVDRLKSP